jgi:hypothetical protein
LDREDGSPGSKPLSNWVLPERSSEPRRSGMYFLLGNADQFLSKESVMLDSSEVLLLVPEDLAGGSDCILEEVSWVSFPRFHFPSFLGQGD